MFKITAPDPRGMLKIEELSQNLTEKEVIQAIYDPESGKIEILTVESVKSGRETKNWEISLYFSEPASIVEVIRRFRMAIE